MIQKALKENRKFAIKSVILLLLFAIAVYVGTVSGLRQLLLYMIITFTFYFVDDIYLLSKKKYTVAIMKKSILNAIPLVLMNSTVIILFLMKGYTI